MRKVIVRAGAFDHAFEQTVQQLVHKNNQQDLQHGNGNFQPVLHPEGKAGAQTRQAFNQSHKYSSWCFKVKQQGIQADVGGCAAQRKRAPAGALYMPYRPRAAAVRPPRLPYAQLPNGIHLHIKAEKTVSACSFGGVQGLVGPHDETFLVGVVLGNAAGLDHFGGTAAAGCARRGCP